MFGAIAGFWYERMWLTRQPRDLFMSSLARKHCVPCEGGALPMKISEVEAKLHEIHPAWDFEGGKIRRYFQFKDFKAAMGFVDHVAEIAESEGHHPDIKISYNRVVIELATHAIHGLSENDFIMAAKIDALGEGALTLES